ncbi:MAG: AAA family ATPase [Nitrospinota bacterium]
MVNLKSLSLDISYYRDWVAKRENIRKAESKRPFFVTISREYGCEGRQIAESFIAKRKADYGEEWTIFTRKILDEMISDDELTMKIVSKVTKEPLSYKDWFIDSLVPDYLKSPSSKIFEKMQHLIISLAEKGNVLFLGAGSQIITHNLSPRQFNALHIRVIAGLRWRIKRIAKVENISLDAAEKIILERQGLRERFLGNFTVFDPTSPTLYNMIFNNSRADADLIVNTLYNYVQLSEARENIPPIS